MIALQRFFREAGRLLPVFLNAFSSAFGLGAKLRKAKRPSRLVARPVRSPSGVRTEEQHIEQCSMSMVNENDQADRAISNGKLHTLLRFHTRPINVVVFHGSDREYSFLGWFPA